MFQMKNCHTEHSQTALRPYTGLVHTNPMILNITDRQATILGIALTVLYDTISKSGEGKQMRKEASELHKMIVDLQSSNLK